MLHLTKFTRTLQLFAVFLFATACADGGSNDPDGGTGGSPSTCDVDENGCEEGFECDDSGDEVECVDIDECAEGQDDCDDDAYCVNNEGSFSCEPCPAGHELDGDECVDIDECDEGTDSCDEHASCENTDGSHECTCDAGFEGDGEECTDIDECAEGTDDCDDDLYCVNSEGSFSCEACPAGHELDGDECVDIDECESGTDSCDENASCENTDGSYECTCDAGFEGDGEECTDIDECEEGLDECDDELYCINNEGSFSCQPCPAGYGLDGDACVDIDECAVDNGGCGDLTAATCENSEGSFTCLCNDGYLLVEDTCVYTVPHVIASTPLQGEDDVYPSEFYLDVESGIRERVTIQLTFDREMNTDEATIVVTDEAGLEEPRTFEGSWDETGHILTAFIMPHDGANPSVALHDETTYVVSFEDLESSYGTPVDPEDTEYPEAQLTFTTGVRIGVLNHACGHVVALGPFEEIDASADPTFILSDFSSPHHHYTINLPPGEVGEPNVGYSYFFPTQTQTYIFYLRDPGSLQVEFALADAVTGEPGPFTPLEIEEAPPACHVVYARLTDPDTGEEYLGPPITGVTHVVSVELDADDFEFYTFKFTSEDSVTYTIVESDSSF